MKNLILPTLVFASTSFASLQAATPIAVTGANADIIYDGAVGSATPFDIPNNYTYIGDNIGFGGTTGNPGIPQTFTSIADSSVQFALLGSYTENNVLQLAQGQSGTLSLTTPSSYSSLYLLTASAQGQGSGVITILFSDSSTLALNYTSSDWYNAEGNIAFGAPGVDGIRVKTDTGGYFYSGQGKAPYLFSYEVQIPAAYQGLAVQSLNFLVAGTDNANLSSAIFGVSGVASVPEPSSLMLGGAAGLLALSRRRRN